jgi:hypothetical protein
MTEIEELERMNYFSDGSTEYLSIDIRGVLLVAAEGIHTRAHLRPPTIALLITH